jgi:hypothetical protein
MSGALDGRIRKLAREEAAALGAAAAGLGDADTDLQAQLRDLHDHDHRTATLLEQLAKRVEALEAAPVPADQERPAVRRTVRKDTAG